MSASIPRTIALYICSVCCLAACATPLDIGTANRSLTPQQAAQTIDSVRQQSVAWGGVIIAGKNLQDKTQFEIVSYPLDDQNRPNIAAAPGGRFIAVVPGYLETADYAPGREVTVIGALQDTRSGKVGEASYTYPVVSATRIHLWPVLIPQSTEPRFHFGIGIGIHN